MNTQNRICPNCQTAVPGDSPAGVCPACALRAGFDPSVGPDSPTLATPEQPAGTSSLADLTRLLPELEDFELIGQGGMGTVYKARHRRLQRSVAVKVLNPTLSSNATFVERFTREARTLAQLDHPNIVSIYDFGHREGVSYLIMEMVDGVSLRHTIAGGKLDAAAALAMVPKICEALQYAHDQGVVHRDIKPENILVDRKGTIKIADFGLAKLVDGDLAPRLTRTEQVMGTPHYMAPEQMKDSGVVDHRADIFALGVVFYELLTGELPVGRFPPPSRLVQVDVRLDEVVLRTLEKEPAMRYQQASELQSDVEGISRGDDQAKQGPAELNARPKPRGYEYRSDRRVFGLPLIHIAFSRDSEGKEMRTATGLIAIGDIAIGGIAIGGFSFGGIAVGGISAGLVSFGGIALGLLTALGGVGLGGFAAGSFTVGLIAARGALHFAALSLSETALTQVTLIGWMIMTGGLTLSATAGIYAWMKAVKVRD